ALTRQPPTAERAQWQFPLPPRRRVRPRSLVLPAAPRRAVARWPPSPAYGSQALAPALGRREALGSSRAQPVPRAAPRATGRLLPPLPKPRPSHARPVHGERPAPRTWLPRSPRPNVARGRGPLPQASRPARTRLGAFARKPGDAEALGGSFASPG